MSEGQCEGFQGFTIPKQNYFKVPNEWINITAEITSLAEMKVVQYVLRHTWGFHEYGQVKRISLDEFEHGRKTKDGTRMDKGVGMSRPSITDGIRRAVEHGFLIVKTDDSDKGRVKKSYGLQMELPPKNLIAGGSESLLGGKDSLPQEVNKFTPIVERHLSKTPKEIHLGGRTARTHKPPSTNGKSPSLLTTEFDRQAAGRLREILVINDSDLVHPPRSVKIDTLTKQFTVLRTQRGVSEAEIKDVLKWLRNHYGEAMTPKIYKVEQVQTEWGRIRDAKHRCEEGQAQDGPVGREWDPDKDQ